MDELFIEKYSTAKSDIEKNINSICKTNVFKVLCILSIIATIVVIVGLFIFAYDESYRRVFVYILLPLMILNIIDVLIFLMERDFKKDKPNKS